MRVLLERDKTYRAIVSLSWIQSWAENNQVADRFTELGFRNVLVTGSGAERVVEGVWIGADQHVDLSGQPITDVEEIES